MKFETNTPIYVQLVKEIIIAVISGNLKPGEKLPSVREFSLQKKVNPNTMQKALAELENLNLIYTERTNGKYVTNDIKIIKEYKNKYAKKITNNYITNMLNLGYEKEKIVEIIKESEEK